MSSLPPCGGGALRAPLGRWRLEAELSGGVPLSESATSGETLGMSKVSPSINEFHLVRKLTLKRREKGFQARLTPLLVVTSVFFFIGEPRLLFAWARVLRSAE